MVNKESLENHLEEAIDDLERKDRLWREDKVPVDGVTSITSNTARAYHYLSNTAALLGATRQAREWSGEAARYYLERNKVARLRRDIREKMVWNSEPQMFSRALNHALLSHDEALLTEVASEAIAMDESYLDAFVDDYPDSGAAYYQMKVKAALVLDDQRTQELLDQFNESVERLSETSVYWERVPAFYQALLDGSASSAQAAIDDLYEYYVEQDPDADDPRWYVLDALCAFLVLAQRHSMDISVESHRLPNAFIEGEIPDDDNELDVDLRGLQTKSEVGRFELERDEDGTPIVAGFMYHVGDVAVSASDIPDREAGRLLTDEWIEAALEEAEWRDHYDDTLVADSRNAFEDGTLHRKLVVLQDRTDGPTFDSSLTDLPIDKIELKKGASRQN